jgi:hypothetical protein
MKKAWIVKAWMVAMATVALAIPLTATASVSQTDYKNAAKFCKALRADMRATSPTAFKDAYGTNHNHRNAYGKCVSKYSRVAHANHSDAVKACKTEQEANQAEFTRKYGTNKHGSNALGKCVSKQEDQAEQADHDAIVNAAKQCRVERAKDPAAFREHYGTNHNKSNAFGKCVSKVAKVA